MYIKLTNIEVIKYINKSHNAAVVQYVIGGTLDTKCKCLTLLTLSSIRKTTNEAGTKLIANITQIACNKLTPINRLKKKFMVIY